MHDETTKRPVTPLQKALVERDRAYSAAVDLFRAATESDPDAFATVQDLREAVELVRCLRRLLEGQSVQTIHKAFGAPGDFGYETALGAALDRTYRGETKEER